MSHLTFADAPAAVAANVPQAWTVLVSPIPLKSTELIVYVHPDVWIDVKANTATSIMSSRLNQLS